MSDYVQAGLCGLSEESSVLCLLSTVLGGGMSIGTVSPSHGKIFPSKNFALGGFCGLCAGRCFDILVCALCITPSPSRGFSHTLQVKRCSLLLGLTYGSMESYIFSPASLFPLSELFAPTRYKNGEQHGYFASYFAGVNRIRCFRKKALGKMGTYIGSWLQSPA